MMTNKKTKSFLLAIILVLSSIAFYTLATLQHGFYWIFTFVAIMPLFWLSHIYSVKASFIGAGIAGAFSITLSCMWLTSYHKLAYIPSMVVGAFFFALSFALISFLSRKKHSIIIPALIWGIAETARAYGPLPFAYAALPYSLAGNALAMKLASIGGVELVGLIVAIINMLFFEALSPIIYAKDKRKIFNKHTAFVGAATLACVLCFLLAGKAKAGSELELVSDTGIQAKKGYFRIALVQSCANDAKQNYPASFASLQALSEAIVPYNADLVVWHETAIIPPLFWHLKYRPDQNVYSHFLHVKSWLELFPIAILTGNARVPLDDAHRTNEYNSALLIKNGLLLDHYDKIKLVPFSEYLPSFLNSKSFSKTLQKEFGKFWTKGESAKVFEYSGARFASPICFEDSFNKYFASFKQPDFYAVLTNDAWAQSHKMQKQHLAMSQFRAAETGCIVVRSASTGSTAAISNNGAVAFELPYFEPGTLIVDAALNTSKATVYNYISRFGYFAIHIAVFSLWLIVFIIIKIIKPKIS